MSSYREWLAEHLDKEVEEITALDYDTDSYRIYLNTLSCRLITDRIDDITSEWDAEVN